MILAMGLYETLLLRDVLRPLLAQLGSRHRLPVAEVRSPVTLRTKLVVFFGSVTVFASGLVLLFVLSPSHALGVMIGSVALALALALGLVLLIVRDMVSPSARSRSAATRWRAASWRGPCRRRARPTRSAASPSPSRRCGARCATSCARPSRSTSTSSARCAAAPRCSSSATRSCTTRSRSCAARRTISSARRSSPRWAASSLASRTRSTTR